MIAKRMFSSFSPEDEAIFDKKKHGVLKRDGLQTPPANKVFGSHLASLQGQERFVAIEVLFGEMLMWQVFMTFTLNHLGGKMVCWMVETSEH